MSAAELIQRFGITGCVAEFIESDVRHAQKFTALAAEIRLTVPDFAHDGLDYTRNMYLRDVESYMAQARADGHLIRTVIRKIVDQESEQAREMVQDGQAYFAPCSCAGETCYDCERPIWHHIRAGDDGLLCPFGRRYWQLARAILMSTKGVTDADMRRALRVIAKRA